MIRWRFLKDFSTFSFTSKKRCNYHKYLIFKTIFSKHNFPLNFILQRLFEYFLNPKLDAYAAKYFDANVPSIRELEHRTVLALINTNSAMDFSSPLPENVIPVAGVHIMEPKPLPEVSMNQSM